VHGDGRLHRHLPANRTFQLPRELPVELWYRLQLTADIVNCDIDGIEEFIAGATDGRLLAIGTDASDGALSGGL
jgi:hypothetical protein